MNLMKKYLAVLTSQIKRSSVKLAVNDIPHKITDDNQSITDGVIHEKSTDSLRSQVKPRKRNKRGNKSKR